MEDMQAIAQGEFHEYTQRKRPRDLAWLPLFVLMGRRTLLFTGCSPEGEDGTDSDVGTEGTPST